MAPIELEWTPMTTASATSSGPVRVAWRDRVVGGLLAATLSLLLATPAAASLMSGGEPGGLAVLAWLGLFGAPVVLVAGAWLTPMAANGLLEAALAIGSVAAFGGLGLAAASALLGGSSTGFGDGLVAAGFVLMFGFPLAVAVAAVLTIPMGALWAALVRPILRRAA
jgi:hypothetical protein